MSDKTLHIISFDVPYPPTYGGIVDVYFKLKEFHKVGIKIILHCFYKEITDIKHLNYLCQEVHLYKRKRGNIFNTLPYIVSSRTSGKLTNRLEKDNYPILIEGIHCTGFLKALKNKDRKIGLRTHNIEHDYYLGLSKLTNNRLKKTYYKNEANRLKSYEKKLDNKIDFIFSLSQKDCLYYKTRYKNAQTFYTCAFYDNSPIVKRPKNYVLLQGNFTVDENIKAGEYLLEKIVHKLPKQQFIIAGKEASLFSENYTLPKNVVIASSLSKDEMTNLNNEAKVSIVYSNLNAGVKLKILNSLSAGVPVLCNKELHLDPYLKNCVQYYQSDDELIKLIQTTDWKVTSRTTLQSQFKSIFNTSHFASQILQLLF